MKDLNNVQLFSSALHLFHLHQQVFTSPGAILDMFLFLLALLVCEARPLDILTELLLVDVELRHELLVCLPHGLDLKETVHGFERHALGFRNEEEGEDEGTERQGGKEEVDTESHGRKHLLREAGNQKVPQPVVRGGGSLGEGANIGIEQFLKVSVS